ncbi:MAG: D-glycerate dehydrogenase [Bdellovibrionaceae bacterium]|nr:D-glycerate dehydrogenase [Pseudobdellovibrionaceae bacterium]
MKPKVLIYKKSFPQEVIDKVLAPHFDVFVLGIGTPEFKEHLKDTVGIIGWGGRIDRQFLEQAPKLKAFSTISVGYDHCDLAAMNELGIRLMHTPDVLTEAVADSALALMLATTRRVVELDRHIRQGQWVKSVSPEWYGQNMYKKTLGIVGMGRIGKAIARRAHFGFDMNILYHSRTAHHDAEQETHAQFIGLDELLQSSDFVCCVLPKTPQTLHYFKQEHFEMMKSTAIFINVGRGQVVKENDLAHALVHKTIYAAGLDVFEVEPLPLDSPLLSLDNVVLFPHASSATVETRFAMDEDAAQNLVNILTKPNTIKNCVNPNLC